MVDMQNNIISNLIFKSNLKALNQEMKSFTGNLKTMEKAGGRFRGDLLSTMFIVMGLNRVLTQFTRSAITSFQKANEDTEGLGKATWHLQAAWEFFKYSLIDALTQSPLFKVIVELLVRFVQWLNRLSPGKKAILAIVIALLLLALPLSLIIIQFGILAATMNTSLASAFLFVASIILGVILVIIGIGVVIWAVMGIIENWGEDWAAVIKYIGYFLIGLGIIILGVALLIGSWPVAIAAAVVIIIGLLVVGFAWIMKNWDKVSMYLNIAWIWLTASLKKTWVLFVKLLVNMFLGFAKEIAMVIDGVRIAFILLVYAIQRIFQQALSWLLGLFSRWIEGILVWVRKIPGIGNSIADGVMKGINTAKKAIDGWGTSIEATKNLAMEEVKENGAVKQINEIKDLTDEYYDKKIDLINAERDAAIKATKDEFEVKQKAIQEEMEARKKAAELEQEEKGASIGIMDKIKNKISDTLGVGQADGTSPLDKLQNITNSTTGDKVSNVAYNDNRTLNFSGLSEEQVRVLLEEDRQKTIDELNRTNDSALS